MQSGSHGKKPINKKERPEIKTKNEPSIIDFVFLSFSSRYMPNEKNAIRIPIINKPVFLMFAYGAFTAPNSLIYCVI